MDPDFLSLVSLHAIIGLGFSAGLMASFKASSIWVPIDAAPWPTPASCPWEPWASSCPPNPRPIWYASGLAQHSVFGGLILAGAAFVFLAVPEKDEAKITAGLGGQVGELVQILKLPLFWRFAPMVALSAGIPIALQTLWAGPGSVMCWALPVEVARSLFWMAAAFMVGIFIVGVVADRLQKRGIGPMTVLLGFVIANLAAQAVIVFQVKVLAFPAWLVLSAVGQAAILAYPWFAQRVGAGLAGRSNATINFAMFLVALPPRPSSAW